MPARVSYVQDHVRRMHREVEISTRRLELEKRHLTKLDQELKRTLRDLATAKSARTRPLSAAVSPLPRYVFSSILFPSPFPPRYVVRELMY